MLPSDEFSNSGDVDFIFSQGNIHLTSNITQCHIHVQTTTLCLKVIQIIKVHSMRMVAWSTVFRVNTCMQGKKGEPKGEAMRVEPFYSS